MAVPARPAVLTRPVVSAAPAVTAEVAPAVVDELKLDDGGEIWAAVKPSDISAYPP